MDAFNTNDDATDVIKIGEDEYKVDELEALIKDGKFKREVEEKQNTSLDKVMGAFTKLSQDAKTWEEVKAENAI